MSLGVSFTIAKGRALMAAMQPITGNRAAGQIRLRAKPGVQLTVPRYAYWAPVIDGQRATSWLFKATDGPNSDKSWTVNDTGTSTITVMSNIGGLRHNVPVGTQFRPDLPVDDLVIIGADQPVAVADFLGGTNPAEYAGVQDMAIFETFDGPALTTDIHRSPVDRFPAILLAFQDFTPADGVAIAQNNQMAINAGTDKKFYKTTYTISVITARGEGDMSRRQEGMILIDAVVQLLNDKHSGDPGECLSNPGGVQVRQVIREDGPQDIYQKYYIYTALISCMTTLQRVDFRTFSPWLSTVMNVQKSEVNAPTPTISTPSAIGGAAVTAYWSVADRVDGTSPGIAELPNAISPGNADMLTPNLEPDLIDRQGVEWATTEPEVEGGGKFFASDAATTDLWPALAPAVTMWISLDILAEPETTSINRLMSSSDAAASSGVFSLRTDAGKLSLRVRLDSGSQIFCDYPYKPGQVEGRHVFTLHFTGAKLQLWIDGEPVKAVPAVGVIATEGARVNIGSNVSGTLPARLNVRTVVVWNGLPDNAEMADMNNFMLDDASIPFPPRLTLARDQVIDMTPGIIDLVLAGSINGGDGFLWVPPTVTANGQLLVFEGSRDRRISDPNLGVFMEPAHLNDMGTGAEDLTDAGWVAAGGATVTPDFEPDPIGNITADRLDFTAGADSQLDFAGLAAEAGAPVVLQCFAKAVGNKFTTSFRLAAVDAGAMEHVSDDFAVGPVWDLYRFEVIPTTTGALTLRLKNASDAQARQIMIWGVNYSDEARWGPQYDTNSFDDRIIFGPVPAEGPSGELLTPQSVLTGRWRLRFITPDDVLADVIGTATGAPVRTLVSVGDGATELVTLTLTGTPATGGAQLTLSTRTGGAQIALSGLEWAPGAELQFSIDATGMLTVVGTLNGDGEFSFQRYVEDALPADFLSIGYLSTNTGGATPGRYVSIETDV